MPHRTLLFLALTLAVASVAHAQDTSSPADQDARHATPLSAVRVTGHHADGYDADRTQLGSYGGGSLHDTPASVVVFTRDQIDDRQPRSLSELAQGDAALGDNYAAVGYYQDITVRGFALDYATSFRQNNLTIAGAQLLPLEDKQRVEVLKGLAGIEAGVVAPGGLINYVSKRPADVHTVTLGTDSHGSRYGAADLGAWLTPNFGLRFNAAYEDTHSFVQHADGRRNFYSLAADWKISPSSLLQLDGDYQTSAQRDASGYQLLGGTVIPSHASRTRMLGFEPWQQPVSIEAANLSARYTYTVNEDWRIKLGVGHSRSVIDDNVAYPYGCFYAASCASGATPGYFFGADGSYDIYDYRSPDDTRNNDEARASVLGHLDSGRVGHDLTLGVQAFRRTVDQRQEVYDYVGTANIDQDDPPYFAPSSNQPGPSARRLDSWQRSGFALDRMHLGEQWQVLAGARFVRLNERAYDDSGVLERTTRLSKTLPQAAVLWQPNAAVTAYASYGESLSLGQEAPYWTSNPDVIMAPIHSRQVEAGVKYAVGDHLDLSAAVYRIRQPYQYAQPDDSAEGFTFVQSGQEVHTGLELGAHGRLTPHLRVAASASYIRARAEDTGTAAYNGKQVANVPKLRTAVNLDYTLPFAPRLAVLGGWQYSAPKAALPDDSVRVGAYNVFDAGLRLSTHIAGHAATWRLMVTNLFDRFYWRDTGSVYGDRFLFPGEPRLSRLSVKFDL